MKKFKLFIFIFICLLMPSNVFAFELKCESNVINYGEDLICHLTGNSSNSFTLLSGNISSTDNLVNCAVLSYAKGLSTIDNSSLFVLKGSTSEDNYVTFKCQLNEKLSEIKKTQIKIDNFKYQLATDESINSNEIVISDFISANIYRNSDTSSKPRDTSNSDTLLKVLYEENLNLTFSRFVTTYNQEVLNEVEELNLVIIPNNENSTFRIIGNGIENNTKLNVGNNVIDIYVTSENGDTTCYTINVTRLEAGEDIYYPEKDATLNSLIIPGYAISFNKDVLEYKIHLASDVTKLNINATPSYEEANVDISSSENLKNGSVIKVTVTSKDKSNTSEYIIKITKDAQKKNYNSYIILGVVGLILIILIIIFIKTSQSKKSSKKNKLTTNNNNTLNNDSSANLTTMSNQALTSNSTDGIQNIQNITLNNNIETTNISQNPNNNGIN